MIKKTILFLTLLLLILSCDSSDESGDVNVDNFDRGVLLSHLADNIIIPSYQEFSTKMSDLKSAGQTFVTNPDQANLEAFRNSWLQAYKNWQHVEMFDIGKADELLYYFHMNVFPISVTKIEQGIASGNYDLSDSNYHDAQGFPALDYFLHGVAPTDLEILEKYTTSSNATVYKAYITDILNKMSDLTTKVSNDWSNGFRDVFVSSTSNTATSSLNKIVNDYVFYYEKRLRSNKVGIPAGVFSSNPLPEKVEAFYNQTVSKELVLESLDVFKDVFEGKYKGNASANRSSFQQYLQALDRDDISSAIINQLAVAKTQLNALNGNFFEQINQDNKKMTQTYDELQKAVVLLKTDMLQAFSVNLDYEDGDGDG